MRQSNRDYVYILERFANNDHYIVSVHSSLQAACLASPDVLQVDLGGTELGVLRWTLPESTTVHWSITRMEVR